MNEAGFGLTLLSSLGFELYAEVQDNYEISGNIWAVIAVVYLLVTGAQMPVNARPNEVGVGVQY